MMSALHQTRDFCEANNLLLVVKEHPQTLKWGVSDTESKSYQKALRSELNKFSKLPYVKFAFGDIKQLILPSLAVATLNSGTGFEAMIYSKPVISFANSDFRTATFVGLSSVSVEILRSFDPYYSALFCKYFLQYHCFINVRRVSTNTSYFLPYLLNLLRRFGNLVTINFCQEKI